MKAVDGQADPTLPVFSIEAEQQLLGALLTNNENFSRTSGMVDTSTFYDPVHARIFDEIKTRIDAGQLASPVTIKPMFENDEGLKQLGGVGYLARLAGASVGTYAISDYSAMLADFAAKREILNCLEEAKTRIAAGEGAAAIAATVETSAGALLNATSSKPLIQSHLRAVTGAVTRINAAYQGEQDPGVSTGLPQLDEALGMLRDGNLIVIGGRPSMGKTTLAQNLVKNAADAGKGVFFPSLEMNAEEISTRSLALGLAQRGEKIAYKRMLEGNLSEAEMRLVVDEAKRQESLPIQYGERDVREVTRLRAAAKRAQQHMADSQCPLGLIVIDYMQLIQSSKHTSAYDRASAASDMCKSLALEMKVPVVALAQLSRGVEQRDPAIPQLSDLRESGKLEEDADVVMFTYRDAYYLERKLSSLSHEDSEKQADYRAALERCRDQMDVIIAKQRSGPLKTVPVYVDLATSHVMADRAGGGEYML